MSKIFIKNTPFDPSRKSTTKKIVINSNIYYTPPLEKLLSSLIEIGFVDLENVIIVRGRCERNTEPHLVKISEITSLNHNQSVVLVDMELNNFDYTGFHALYVYKDHHLIKSDWYMYILDTSTFEHKFIEFINRANLLNDELVIGPCPHSNICAFGYNIINNYGNNFSIPVTKEEAIALEHNYPINKDIKSILHFGNIFNIDNRKFVRIEDIYNTGRPRHQFYYPYFGINKWILWGSTGDIHSKKI